jgi:ParB family chromosome partitioning protein
VIVRDLDDDAATIIMVDSNIQRENILPSERAKAYKMKLEAIKHQGQRTDLTSVQVGQKLQGKISRDLLAENSPDSSTQIQRFIRLNELTPQLQQMVDDKKIAMTPAVELSYLKPEEQTLLLDTIESEQATPSLSQAQRLKNFSQEGHLNEDSMLAIMSEEKKPEKNDLTIKADKLQKYFPKSYTPQQMEQVIIRLLDGWQKKRQRDQER